MGFLSGLLDKASFIYFATHIPIAVCIDWQLLLPSEWYPQQLKDLVRWYSREFKDPMVVDGPAWYTSFVLCEMFLQFPFFWVAAYAFFKGNTRWLRIPLIIYSTHVATTLIAIFYHIAVHDFSGSPLPGPSTDKERIQLCAIYSPYFIMPMIILLRAICNSEYPEYTMLHEKKKR